MNVARLQHRDTEYAEPMISKQAAGETVGISVVVPVYKSELTISVLVERIISTLKGVADFEVILVEDGGRDSTWKVIERLASNFREVQGVQLSRNSGQHAALLAGIRDARYSTTVTIDDDLQFMPEEIPALVSLLTDNQYDVVYGVPSVVEQNTTRRLSGRLIRRALRTGLNVDEAPELSPFRAFRTNLREAFDLNLGPNVSLDALLSWTADRYGAVSITHQPREHGRSNYTISHLVRHAVDIATGYSSTPLRIASVFGLVTAVSGFSLLIYFIIDAFSTGQSAPGFRMLFAGITILSGVQLICIGVIGEYISRMHFRIMGKPTYTIRARTSHV